MSDAAMPVMGEEDQGLELRDEIGIAFSGGGYRAMLFHAGAIIRLFETGLIQQAARISSVSGGSITSAKLALEWPVADRAALIERVIDPIRDLAGTTIDVSSVLSGMVLPGNAADRIAAAYADKLFGDATLQDLPDQPTFVINATNIETGKLWRFTRKRARDWSVGEILSPTFRLADVVAASSAFPPVLSPFVLDTRPADFTSVERGVDPKFLESIALTDGGVYDNLGLETIFKRCRTLLVSNGGGALDRDPRPASDWLRHTRRVIDVIHAQVSSVRTRQLIDTFKRSARSGTYWGIGSDIAAYGAPDPLPVPAGENRALASIPTRLSSIEPQLQERVINWGYAICDTALRRWLPDKGPYPAPAFPYPAS